MTNSYYSEFRREEWENFKTIQDRNMQLLQQKEEELLYIMQKNKKHKEVKQEYLSRRRSFQGIKPNYVYKELGPLPPNHTLLPEE